MFNFKLRQHRGNRKKPPLEYPKTVSGLQVQMGFCVYKQTESSRKRMQAVTG